MQTRDKGKQSEEEQEKRDLELENIAGNLLIAEYQVDRLRTRLSDMITGYRPEIDYGPQMSNNNKASTHVFKNNKKWYKISLRIDETDATGNKDGQDHMI